MTELSKGAQVPNLFLTRPDGTSLELYDLWKKEHCVLVLAKLPHPDLGAFLSHFQDQARLFSWLDTRLLPVFPRREMVPSPWPAPGYPPCLFFDPLPQGLEWDRAYVISKHRTLFEYYADLGELTVAKLEKDLLYWEAGHCLP